MGLEDVTQSMLHIYYNEIAFLKKNRQYLRKTSEAGTVSAEMRLGNCFLVT